ncbi:MAG: TonB family protein [Rhizomicrobium sp.]|nr:TonB family protein [Rhizomicrobium sp.]
MFRLLLGAVLAALLALPAAAEDIFRPATVTPVGTPHSCNGFYPAAARLAHIEGVTTLAFHIDPNGAVRHVSISKSSGNEDLDDAAASCVRTWRYAPTLKDGKPIEVAWSADTEWRVRETPAPALMPVLTERDDSCMHYPFWARRDGAEGTASVEFTITADGHPSEISLGKPSGNEDLDKAALECVKSMRFRVPDSAAHAVSATATWSILGHSKALQWRLKGFLGSEQMEAITELAAGVVQCLKGVAGHSEFASGLSGTTVVWTTYHRGEIDAASVLRTSGNDALDHFAVECFKSAPPDADRAHALRHVGKAIFPVKWSRYLLP